jgi:two-component system, LytTR family, response regulator
MKALIVDDEPRARRILEELLKEYCPTVEVIDTADDVPNAVKAIQKHKPDVVFLDIEMPQYTGFQLFEFFEEITFEVIFTTAYRDYALQAFQVDASDYLLKPIQIGLLMQAVEKVQKYIEAKKQTNNTNAIHRITVPFSEGLMFLEPQDIITLKAEGSYTQVCLVEDKKVLVSKNIKFFEDLLKDSFFFRPHRSFIINLNFVKQYLRQDGGIIVMENGDQVYISREKRDEFLQKYQA